MSNIGKRFAKPAVWEQPYFTKLNLKQRLFWLYLNQRCDLAGVHQLHFPVDTGFLGYQVDQPFIESFIESINFDSQRVQSIDGHRLWLLDFVRYQQTGKNSNCLSAKSPPHISVVGKLKEHGIFSLAVKRDPELYRGFTEEIPEPPQDDSNNDSKGKPTLKQGYRKGYSNSNSNGTSKGKSVDNGNAPPSIEEGEDFSDIPLDDSEVPPNV